MLEDHAAVLVQNVAAGGDIELEGLGVLAYDDVVQGVDALEDGDLIVSQPQGLGENVGAHLAGEFKFGHVNGPALVQHGEVAVQQVDVQTEGGFVVDGPIPVPGGGLRVHGVEVVVHGDGVGYNPHLLELLFNLHGGGGLAGAGGAGEEHDMGLPPAGGNFLGGPPHLLGVGAVAPLGKALGIGADLFVDLPQGVGHGEGLLSHWFSLKPVLKQT